MVDFPTSLVDFQRRFPDGHALRVIVDAQNEALKIFSYPDHQSLMISKRDCVVVDSERPIGMEADDLYAPNLFTYRCAVPIGAGGAPIFGDDNNVVGIVYAKKDPWEWGKRGEKLAENSSLRSLMAAARQ